MKKLLLIIIPALVSCQSSDEAKVPIEYIDCSTWENWNAEDGLQCGFIMVPENHSEPNGKQIQLAFAVKKGKSDTGYPSFQLSGGPGGDAMRNMNRFQRDSLLEIGDIILVDQRGMGKSSELPDMGADVIEILAEDLTLSEESIAQGRLMDSARQVMKGRGVNPSNYNSTQNALDFGVLMDALGYEKYNLWGGSYGTKLGVYIMKHFPDRINAAVLTAPATLDNRALENRFPDLVNSLEKLLAHCAEDPECSAQYPNLSDSLFAAISKLKVEPLVMNLDEGDFIINPQDAIFLVRYMLYRPNAIELITGFIDAVNSNKPESIIPIYRTSITVFNGINTSTFYSFNAYEEFSDESMENINKHIANSRWLSEFGLAWFQTFIPHLSRLVDVRASEADKTLEGITVPTLVVTNSFDPVTPPENAEMFVKAIPGAQVLNSGNFGHGIFSNCMAKIRRGFLLDPKRAIDDSCL
ncbi:MAG: alpha/beta fold hydrolase [Cyclobacteriaceae bacterium]